MATVIQPVDQPVLMDGVSWETYEALLADGGDCRQTWRRRIQDWARQMGTT